MADYRKAAFPVAPWLGIQAAEVLLLNKVGEKGNSLKFNIKQRLLRDPETWIH